MVYIGCCLLFENVKLAFLALEKALDVSLMAENKQCHRKGAYYSDRCRLHAEDNKRYGAGNGRENYRQRHYLYRKELSDALTVLQYAVGIVDKLPKVNLK